MSSDPAIRAVGLGKCYNIYRKPVDRLLQMLVRQRRRYYREFWALRDVSFEVARGETVGIIGRNGSGKSTLLQLICGTLTPTLGAVETRGRVGAILELGSGFNMEFTGRENVRLNASILGLPADEIDRRFDDIAAFADIGDFMDQPVKTYSSGMVLRLAFAVQAMIDPDILVVDEALAVGDEKFQRKCFARLEELRDRGTSILFVSHYGAQVIELCDRAILLDAGQLLMDAVPQQAVRAYQRVIYAPHSQRDTILQEVSRSSEIVLTPDARSGTSGQTEEKLEGAAFFDPDLVPSSTVIYPPQGAEILGFEIQDMGGDRVNILRSRSRYRIVVSGRVLDNIERVHFGAHIRTTSGLELTWQRYPHEGVFIELLTKGTNFSVSYSFHMLLPPGVYFSGGGVWVSHPEFKCAHRVVDAVMFRVVADSSQFSFGYCDLSSAKPSMTFDNPG